MYHIVWFLQHLMILMNGISTTILWFWLGTFSTPAMGSHRIRTSITGTDTCSFFGLVPCFSNSFGSFHVACWNDIWIRSGICHNYGWNNHWNGPSVLDWFNLSWQNSCKILIALYIIHYAVWYTLHFLHGSIFLRLLKYQFLLAWTAMDEKMAPKSCYAKIGWRWKLVPSV